jgi:oligopeptide/dipeptide ABC transporter ATP-binding protein
MLVVENLSVEYEMAGNNVYALEDVSFEVPSHENVGIVGESGCGKTTLIKALLRLLPRNGKVTSGTVRFNGKDLLALSASEMRKVRWKHISFVTQAAMNALNPVLSVKRQMTEAILTHQPETDRKAAVKSAERLFELVGLNPNRLAHFPHQFSGGMKQRAVIAMALALNPEIIVADEPTTALDVIVQAQILEKLIELQQETKNSLIIVTHDMSVVAQICTRVIVMYGGRVVESGLVRDIFHRPHHPYTMGLRNAFPSLVGPKLPLVSIPGTPPSLREKTPGCIFAPRCPFAVSECLEVTPPLHEVAPDHLVACHRTDIAEEMRARAADRATWLEVATRDAPASEMAEATAHD